MRLREGYLIVNCFRPESGDSIIGYYSHENYIKGHRATCRNLDKAEKERLIYLSWAEIIAGEKYTVALSTAALDKIDLLTRIR